MFFLRRFVILILLLAWVPASSHCLLATALQNTYSSDCCIDSDKPQIGDFFILPLLVYYSVAFVNHHFQKFIDLVYLLFKVPEIMSETAKLFIIQFIFSIHSLLPPHRPKSLSWSR